MPDYFSKQVSELNLDTDHELDDPIQYPLSTSCTYTDEKAYFEQVFVLPVNEKFVAGFITLVNHHMETYKPSYVVFAPFFVDWVVPGALQTGYNMNDFVLDVGDAFYEVDFQEAAHYNVLPASVRRLTQFNNCLYPLTINQAAVAETVRVRINIAPNTKVAFSTDGLLKACGFSNQQIGMRSGHKQFIFENKTDRFLSIVAENVPQVQFHAGNYKITISAPSKKVTSAVHVLEVSKRVLLKHDSLLTVLTKPLQSMSESLNHSVTVTFNNNKFQFAFPATASGDPRVTLHLPVDLSILLGYGPVEYIDKSTPCLMVFSNPEDITNSQRKAVALVYDTGLVVCTLNMLSSNTTVGATDHFMAALYPNDSGIMDMLPGAYFCSSPPFAVLTLHSGASGKVPVQFNLLRIYDNEKLEPFEWKTSGFVFGVLQVKPIKRQIR